MAEHDATDQEHPRQITQGKLVAQAPEHHERDHVTGVLRAVQNADTPLVELLATGPTTEPALTQSRALTPFRNGYRAAPNAFHRANPARRDPIPHTARNRKRAMARALTEPLFRLDQRGGCGVGFVRLLAVALSA
jgi:hypothetical protein